VENLDACFRGIPAVGDTKLKGITTALSGGNRIVTIRSPRTVTGVTLGGIVSSSLTTWQNGPVPVLAGTTPTPNIYRLPPPAAAPRQFVRFIVSDMLVAGP